MSFEMAPFDTSFTSSHFSSIITVAISCIVSKIKQDTSRKCWLFYIPLLHNKRLGKMEYFSTGPLITNPDLWPTRCCKQISEILQFMHSSYRQMENWFQQWNVYYVMLAKTSRRSRNVVWEQWMVHSLGEVGEGVAVDPVFNERSTLSLCYKLTES